MAALKEVNVLKHVLVPQHKILSQKEVDALLTAYDISALQLPTMKLNDAVAKHIRAKLGDIIKVERQGLLGKYPHYWRIVE